LSALGYFYNEMRYINLRFTYLLTYLLTSECTMRIKESWTSADNICCCRLWNSVTSFWRHQCLSAWRHIIISWRISKLRMHAAWTFSR